jgi:hercynylcysteine S-oxide lyase
MACPGPGGSETGDPAGPWLRWRQDRPPAQNLHLDTAAAGRVSAVTLRAAAAHAEREAAVGAYVAQAEAEPVLAAGRAALAGLLGVPAGGLAFTESASSARSALLSAWPLPEGGTVGVLPSEWGPNLFAFTSRGFRLAELPAGEDGTLDTGRLEGFLAATPLSLVHLTQVASHRPLAQPVARAAELCHAAGVPLWVDAAQALGHVDTACGADAVYATGRKWLTGPRGAGALAVAQDWWERLGVRPSPLELAHLPDGATPVHLLEPNEASIAGRVALCAAVRQYLDLGPAAVWQRLGEVGALTRHALSDLPGWEVVAGPSGSLAITALRPTRGQQVPAVRARLLSEHRIVTTAAQAERAPREMTVALLRVSPHVDGTAEDLGRLRQALTQIG